MVRILLADDHDIVRHGLRKLLEREPGWEVCGEARDGRSAVEMAEALAPDVAVLDVAMPELNGLEATRKIRAACPATEVLVFTMHESEELVAEADRLKASLIVIGLRRRTPTGKLLTGSQAQRTLLDANCPVLAVKASD